MFYDKYVALCKRNNISPSRAAQEIGFNKSSITNWKNNGYTPRKEILVSIADYFNVSVDYLLGKASSNTSEPSEHINTIKIAGRDGSYEERALTDEQLELFKKMIAALPEATDL